MLKKPLINERMEGVMLRNGSHVSRYWCVKATRSDMRAKGIRLNRMQLNNDDDNNENQNTDVDVRWVSSPSKNGKIITRTAKGARW